MTEKRELEPVAWLYEPVKGVDEKPFIQPHRANMDDRYWLSIPLYDARAHTEGYEAAVRDVVAWLRGMEREDTNWPHHIALRIERGECRP